MALKSQPQFFKTNDDQSIVIVSSNDDGLYIDMNKDLEVDIDEEYQIANIKEIIFDTDDDVFYILANKYT